MDVMDKYEAVDIKKTIPLDLAAKCKSLEKELANMFLVLRKEDRMNDCEAKVLLQGQLHADRIRLIEITHDALKSRCTAMAVSAEQNRLDKLRLEVKHGDLESKIISDQQKTQMEVKGLTALINLQKKELDQFNIQKNSPLDIHNLSKLNQEIESLGRIIKSDANTIQILQGELELLSKNQEALQLRADASDSLLKTHPINPHLNLKVRNILKTSSEILNLANGESLEQVGEILNDLGRQFESHRLLCNVWLDKLN
jgi:hypothetical protein